MMMCALKHALWVGALCGRHPHAYFVVCLQGDLSAAYKREFDRNYNG